MSPTLIILCSVIGLTSGVGVLPDSVNAVVGKTLIFSTSLAPTETPFVSIKWSFEGANIITHNASSNVTDEQYEGRIILFTLTGALLLKEVVHSDAGNYSVTIEPAGGAAAETGSLILNIYEPVTNVNLTATGTDLVEFNDTLTFSCSASGPALSFHWYNYSTELTASDRVHFSDGGTTVTIDPVLRYDEGIYQCRVTNPASIMSRNIRISVSYGPDFAILESTSEHYLSGSDAFMRCETSSKPLTQYTQYSWFVNEKKLWDTGVSYLEIQMNQTGNYSCEVFNRKTLRRIRSKPVPISVWVGIKNPSVTASNEPGEGSPLNLTCDASGSILTREWTANSAEIKPSGNIEFFDENRVLSFRKLSREDRGLYACQLSNPVSSRTAYYSLDVITKSLSAGAIAGIATTTVVGVAAVAGGAFYFYKYK